MISINTIKFLYCFSKFTVKAKDNLCIEADNCLSGMIKIGYCQPWYNNSKIYYSHTVTKHTLLPHKKYFCMTISIKVCRR